MFLWLFPLDDGWQTFIYLGNGWKPPLPTILIRGHFGYQAVFTWMELVISNHFSSNDFKSSN